MALMAVGAAAFGVQKLADKSAQRLENVFGSGLSQRLGTTYAPTQDYMTGLARTGVPMGMVQGLMQAAGGSGAQLNENTVSQFSMMADIAAGSGVDVGVLGALLGAQQRAGVNTTYAMGARGAGAFGRGSLGTFFTELTRTIEDAMQSGISLSQEEVERRANVIAGLATVGGLTPTGAVAMNQMMTSRGQRAGLLQNPEDIIAFQALRKPGMSIAETIAVMEESPKAVNEAMFEYMERASGGNQDELFLRVRRYLGGNATAGQVNAFIATRGGGAVAEGEGLPTAGIYGKKYVLDDKGNPILEDVDPARRTTALLQIEMLKGVQDAMLELTTALSSVSAWIMGRDISTSATDVGLGGISISERKEALQDVHAQIDEIDTMTTQNIQNLQAEVINLNADELKRVSPLINPMMAENFSTIAALRDNPTLQRTIGNIYAATPGYDLAWNDLVSSGFSETFGSGVGSFDDVFQNILGAIHGTVKRQVKEEIPWELADIRPFATSSREEIMNDLFAVLQSYFERSVTSEESMDRSLQQLLAELGAAGFVITDGNIAIPSREP
jgi:hypothetical protein